MNEMKMKKKARKALIKDFTAMVNDGRVIDIDPSVVVCIEIGEPIVREMRIRYYIKDESK